MLKSGKNKGLLLCIFLFSVKMLFFSEVVASAIYPGLRVLNPYGCLVSSEKQDKNCSGFFINRKENNLKPAYVIFSLSLKKIINRQKVFQLSRKKGDYSHFQSYKLLLPFDQYLELVLKMHNGDHVKGYGSLVEITDKAGRVVFSRHDGQKNNLHFRIYLEGGEYYINISTSADNSFIKLIIRWKEKVL